MQIWSKNAKIKNKLCVKEADISIVMTCHHRYTIITEIV